MDETSITAEVRKFIADKIDNKQTIQIEWLTQEIINSKNDIEGADVPFYVVCARKSVKEIVKRCVGKYDAMKPQTDEQILLPGFDHLQVAYTVERGGGIVLVPVEMLSDGELEARALEYEAMAKGCRDHAREIRKYIKERAIAA
jgi:hypothetical protein